MSTATTERGGAPDLAGAPGGRDDAPRGAAGRWSAPALLAGAAAFAGVATYAGYLVLQVAQLLLLRRLAPRFFWLDDSQGQFGPMIWWLGRHLQDGRPPLMDPEQGMAGNITADMQYGALDPLHWGLQALAAGTDDVLRMAWGFGALCVLLLGTGVLVLLRSYRVHRVLAVAGALGVASSGFFLWYGSSWWPLLWSVAWLPWFWWGLAARRWWSVVVLAVATWALLASGNPYVLFFALALLAAQAVELVRAAGTARALLRGAPLARLAALLAGLAVASPTLLTTVQLSSVMARQDPDPVIGNEGFGVANLADVLLGGPTLLGQTNAWGGNVQLVPALYTLLVAVPALALVDWRRAWRAPGVLTAASVYLLAVVFTQLPTTVSVFRYPLRYIVVAELALPLLALLGLTAAAVVTRRRLWIAAGLVAAQGALSWARAPVFVKWHALAVVVVALAVAALVLLLRAPRRAQAVAGAVVLLALTWGTVFVGERMMVSLQDRVDALDGRPSPDDEPLRSLPAGGQLATTVADYRARSAAVDQAVTVITYDFGDDMGWAGGVLRGNGNLLADLRTGGGSLAVWQSALDTHWCRSYEGATCSDAGTLLATAPGTGTAWVDLLSDDTVLLDRDAPQELAAHFDQTWARAGTAGDFVEYRREDGLPGRVTAADGVTVTQQPGGSGLAYGDAPMDTYTVATGDAPGTLAFRIPSWPGLRVTLDGRPLPAGSVDGSVLAVTVPAGVDAGALAVSYVPVGERILVPAFLAGALLLVVAVVLRAVAGRRRPAADTDQRPIPDREERTT
jgi:hypothetical protein